MWEGGREVRSVGGREVRSVGGREGGEECGREVRSVGGRCSVAWLTHKRYLTQLAYYNDLQHQYHTLYTSMRVSRA